VTVVKYVAVATVRLVVVTVGAAKIAERAEWGIRGKGMIPEIPDGTVVSGRLRRAGEDGDPEGTRVRFVAHVSLGSGSRTSGLGSGRSGMATSQESRDPQRVQGARSATERARHVGPPDFEPTRRSRHRAPTWHAAAHAHIWGAIASGLHRRY